MSENKRTTADARTRGDGMEQEAISNQDTVIKKLSQSSMSSTSQSLSYQQPNTTDTSVSLPAIIPKGKIFNLIPHLVSHHGNSHKRINLNKREPKFVPFEPYKAAITPIFPMKNKIKPPKLNRNNLDLNVLVSQMSEMKTIELNDPTTSNDGSKIEKSSDMARLEKEIFELKKERDYFSSELKFQSQVNSELKKLLVAAVGEDIQTKVNVLTEDKLQLARALLDTAQNLSSHTEQIEFLAGQSEVWRSKFLASSLMVEELARWKASLTQKNDKLFASNKCLLELIAHLREMQLEVLRNLKFITNLKSFNIPSSNILDLTSELLNISLQLVLHSGIPGMPDDNLNVNTSNTMTPAEKLAVDALQTSTQPLMPMQEAFKAIFGKAFLSLPSSGNIEEGGPTDTN